MMEEEFEDFTDEQVEALIKRFESAVNSSQHPYFDVEEFEEIIDYYDENHNINKLEIAINNASEIHPYHIHFQIKEAQQLITKKRFNKALDLIISLLDIEPQNLLLKQSLAHCYSGMGKHKLAIELYTEIIELGIDPKETWMNIAYEYENLNQYKSAIEYLKLASNEDPNDDSILHEILFCFEIDNRKEESIEFFSNFVDNHPYSHVGWFNLGISYSNLDLYEKAIIAYDYTLAIDESYSSAYFNKANALINLKNYGEAIKNFKETFKYEEFDGITHLYIGQCYEHLNDYDSAIKHFFKSIEINDKIVDAYVNIALLYFNIEKYNKALPFILEALVIEPDNIDNYYILGDIHSEMKNFEEASIIYKNILEKNPENEEIYFDLAGIYWNMEEKDKAFATLDNGIKFCKENYRNYIRYAEFYYEMGNINMTLNYISIAHNMDHKACITLVKEMTNLIENHEVRELLSLKGKDL